MGAAVVHERFDRRRKSPPRRRRGQRLFAVGLALCLLLTTFLTPSVADPGSPDGPPPQELELPPTPRPASWMSDLQGHIGHLPPNQLVIGGSHDAGAYRFDRSLGFSPENEVGAAVNDVRDSLGPFGSVIDLFSEAFLLDTFEKWGQTQHSSIPDQLTGGMRGFDLRFCAPSVHDPGAIRICHGLYGIEADIVFEQFRAFVQANPDEFLILEVNELAGGQLTDEMQHELRENLIKRLRFADEAATSMVVSTDYGPDTPLDVLWNEQPGRIFVLARDDTAFREGDSRGLIASRDLIRGLGFRADNDTWQRMRKFALEDGLPTRCDPAGAGPCAPVGERPDETDTFFRVSATINPSMELLGGDLVDSFLDGDCSLIAGPIFCIGLEGVARSEGLYLPPHARSLKELAHQGNSNITDEVEGFVLAEGLRPNLNLFSVDFFEQSQLIEQSMRLNTPPVSATSFGTPQASGEQLFVTSSTPVTLRARDRHYGFAGHGNLAYRYVAASDVDPSDDDTPFVRVPSDLGPGAEAATTFTLDGDDGVYVLESFATNRAKLTDRRQDTPLYLDNTPPTITVRQPQATQYLATAVLTLDYEVSDGEGSGIATIEPTKLDGATTVAGHGLDSGQQIDLLTALPLGRHELTVGPAVDRVGNVRPADTTTFEIVVTPASIIEAVDILAERGEIDDRGPIRSLYAQLSSARRSWEADRCQPATNGYGAFARHVRAQSGKSITPRAADILTAHANYLIDHCD